MTHINREEKNMFVSRIFFYSKVGHKSQLVTEEWETRVILLSPIVTAIS